MRTSDETTKLVEEAVTSSPLIVLPEDPFTGCNSKSKPVLIDGL